MSPSPRRLLWTDDDGADWFVYEVHMLAAAGWEVIWAHDVLEAADLLSRQPFDALFLDQMLPWQRSTHQKEALQIWGGCTLLWWLRQGRSPDALPYPERFRRLALWQQAPLPANRTTPVTVVSAFYDEQVEQLTRSAAPQDEGLELLAKPVRLDDLLGFLAALPPHAGAQDA